jgi:hypothetical protein
MDANLNLTGIGNCGEFSAGGAADFATDARSASGDNGRRRSRRPAVLSAYQIPCGKRFDIGNSTSHCWRDSATLLLTHGNITPLIFRMNRTVVSLDSLRFSEPDWRYPAIATEDF